MVKPKVTCFFLGVSPFSSIIMISSSSAILDNEFLIFGGVTFSSIDSWKRIFCDDSSGDILEMSLGMFNLTLVDSFEFGNGLEAKTDAEVLAFGRSFRDAAKIFWLFAADFP